MLLTTYVTGAPGITWKKTGRLFTVNENGPDINKIPEEDRHARQVMLAKELRKTMGQLNIQMKAAAEAGVKVEMSTEEAFQMGALPYPILVLRFYKVI